jgi:nucleotide-binding universal stress UspA family protein
MCDEEGTMTQFRNILVPLDGSVLAERALPPAMELARASSGQLTLLRVVTPIYLWAPFVEIEMEVEAALEQSEEQVRKSLEDVRDRLLEKEPTLNIKVDVLSGPVAETIVDYARDNDVDLIVISSHGRSGLSRWVYGSVAEKVIRGIRCCSTLIVRGRRKDEAAVMRRSGEKAAGH